jgi:hypothetical protein
MLSVTYAECHMKALYAECRYAKCRYAVCRGALSRGPEQWLTGFEPLTSQ